MRVQRLFFHVARVPRDLSLIVVLRLWQAGAGLVTTVMAVRFLSPALQGWYYSFLSVAALYTLFELGLSTVLVQVSAHAFVGLRWTQGDVIEGAGSGRFKSLLGKAVRWYAVMALTFALLLLPSGCVFFGSEKSAGFLWVAPWLVLCCLTAGGLLVTPFLSVLEGSGQIAEIYAVRLALAVCGSLACWAMLATGGKLWATTMIPAAALCVPLLWLVRRRRNLFTIVCQKLDESYEWRKEVWPLQWRLGTSWLCGYLLTQINIPILFHMHGPIVAGQLGLSLAVVNTVGLIAQAWLLRRVPTMAQAAAVGDWHRLDRLFSRDFGIAAAVFLTGAVTVLSLARLLSEASFVQRLLPWPQLLGLFIFALANQLIGGLATQLRSFRREPLVWLTVMGTILTVPLAFYAGRRYSSAGLITVLAAANCLVNLPAAIFIWHRCNRIWRKTT